MWRRSSASMSRSRCMNRGMTAPRMYLSTASGLTTVWRRPIAPEASRAGLSASTGIVRSVARSSYSP